MIKSAYPEEIPLKLPKGTIIATCGGNPAIAAFNYGHGRVLLSGSAWFDNLYDQMLDGLFDRNSASAKSPYLDAAVEWLRPGSDKIRDQFEAAMRKLAVGDDSAALSILDKITAEHSGTQSAEEAGLLAADMLKEKGQLQDASSRFSRLLISAKNPEIKALARLNLARQDAVASKSGVERAVSECWSIWKEDQSNPIATTALIEAGQWSYRAGDMATAWHAFGAVMNSRRNSMDKLQVMIWGALCREKFDDPAGAARIYSAIDAEYPAMPICLPSGELRWDVREYARERIRLLKQ